eukprot:gene7791-biopygen6076
MYALQPCSGGRGAKGAVRTDAPRFFPREEWQRVRGVGVREAVGAGDGVADARVADVQRLGSTHSARPREVQQGAFGSGGCGNETSPLHILSPPFCGQGWAGRGKVGNGATGGWKQRASKSDGRAPSPHPQRCSAHLPHASPSPYMPTPARCSQVCRGEGVTLSSTMAFVMT